jgi:hypothetical protein
MVETDISCKFLCIHLFLLGCLWLSITIFIGLFIMIDNHVFLRYYLTLCAFGIFFLCILVYMIISGQNPEDSVRIQSITLPYKVKNNRIYIISFIILSLCACLSIVRVIMASAIVHKKKKHHHMQVMIMIFIITGCILLERYISLCPTRI